MIGWEAGAIDIAVARARERAGVEALRDLPRRERGDVRRNRRREADRLHAFTLIGVATRSARGTHEISIVDDDARLYSPSVS